MPLLPDRSAIQMAGFEKQLVEDTAGSLLSLFLLLVTSNYFRLAEKEEEKGTSIFKTDEYYILAQVSSVKQNLKMTSMI